MGMEVRLIQAGNGDCILIRCGKSMRKVNILIDSGISKDYFIKALNCIIENKEKIDLLIFTHDDSDHIRGARDLLKLLNREKTALNRSNKCAVWKQKDSEVFKGLFENLTDDRIFFNYGGSGVDVQLSAKEALELFENFKKVDIQRLGFLLSDAKGDLGVPYPNMMQLKWQNMGNKILSEVIRQPNKKELETIGEHLEIVILSPDRQSLADYICDVWKELGKRDIPLKSEKKEKKLNEWEKSIQYWMLHNAAQNHNLSKANRSSIAFLLIYEEICGVFAGDAAPDTMIHAGKQYLTRKGIMQDYLEVDFIKLPHHGSCYNASTEFFQFFRTKNYFITTEGNEKNKHPGKITLALIASALNEGETAHIYSSYSWWKNKKRFVKKELDTENWSSNGDLCELIDAYGNKKYLHFHKTDTKPIWISDNISVRR